LRRDGRRTPEGHKGRGGDKNRDPKRNVRKAVRKNEVGVGAQAKLSNHEIGGGTTNATVTVGWKTEIRRQNSDEPRFWEGGANASRGPLKTGRKKLGANTCVDSLVEKRELREGGWETLSGRE